MQIKIKRTRENAIIPQYQHPDDAGLDLCAAESTVLFSGEVKVISTGLTLEIPRGFEAQVRSRSGLALKHKVIVLNSPGTIDSGYRGEVGVILMNLGVKGFHVKVGDRIAQLVFAQVQSVQFLELTEDESLEHSARGAGGFGSTGVASASDTI